MTAIIGLGNPGEKFKNTRHNVGFLAVEKFAEKNNFPEFKFSKKYNSLISEEIFNEEKIFLAKPQTFMNESGKAVRKITANYKLQTTNLIIVHDDIDLDLGKIKIVKSRGSAGHKGVESIIKNLGTDGFIRFRIGILPAEEKPKNPEKFVLQKFSKEEEKILEDVLEKTSRALQTTLKEGIESAMNKFN